MVTLSLYLLCLSGSFPLLAQSGMQEKIAETRCLLRTDLNESGNKERLHEKLEEVNAGIEEKYRQLHLLGHRKERLRQCKENLEELSFDILEQSVVQIGEAMRKGDTGWQLLEENRLKGRLLRFFKCLERDHGREFPGNEPSPDVYAAFRSLAESLESREVLSAFLSREAEGYFFRDSLQMDSLESILGSGTMHSAQEALRDAIRKEHLHIQQQQSDLEQEIGFLKSIKRKIQDRIEDEAHIDLVSIFMGLPLFCLTIILLFLGPGWIQARYGNGALNPLLEASQSILPNLGTVLLLTMSVLILGLAGNIRGDVLGTLIGGISGYVLNKAKP